MGKPINILFVEDSVDDTAMLVHELKSAGFDPHWKRVETQPDFLAEIKNLPDIILSDYSMPQFSGLRAVELLQKSGLDIPFILISGTVGEDVAVEAMKFGATDYLLKDRIARLGNAVERALLTAKKQAEQKKAEQQILLQTRALEAAANAILITDRQGKILSANTAFCTMTGYGLDEVLGRYPRLLKSGAHEPGFYRQLWETVSAGQTWSGDITNRRKDGTLYQEEMVVTPVRMAGGEVTHFIAIKQDITNKKQAEEELRWKTAFLEAQVNSSPDGILVVDSQHKRIQQNQRLMQLFQVPQEIAEDDDDATLLRHVTGQMKNPGQFLARVEHLYAHPDEIGRDEIELARGVILDRYSSPVRDQAGKYYGRIWVFRDITDRRKLEEQFRQSQKLEGIGQLAGGVAHDFNNILATIQMQAELLKTSGGLSAEQAEYADEIGVTVNRAAALTRQLLLFSRREVFRPRDLDLSGSIAGTLKMLQRILGENIEMQLKLSPQPMSIHADAGMMDQILLNLTVNARDAMPNGGRLVIETSGVEIDEFTASQSAHMQAGSFVCLTVSDSGCGILPEILPKIFEPFFTTKDVGKGTGLGLATVFGIVQQHQGWINVYSEVGRGTVFRIYLPRLAPDVGQKSAQPELANIRGGTETILLVEDDPALRVSVRKALSKLGYRILEAPTGVKALEVWQQYRDEIRLLLTDMVMPDEMTGTELAERLLQENPGLKVIYMSGYSAQIVGKDFPLKEGINFLTKPLQASKLAQVIRDRLDSPS
jgi:PAS domain S-box-containing protein